ncbi:MAG TPA: DUF5700 domain-containing putative Zn-dependent protease [Verrucomicrobiae bacterium]|nr:DUF5700 domain-containing putative Zn-dependent protease [Verrucomicrobiae bacterium]
MRELFTLVCLFVFYSYPRAQKIDAAAAVRYFELTDSLRQGLPLTPEAWKVFLGMDGNRQYIENQAYSERFLENYRKAMEVVYMPQNDTTLQRRLKDPQNNFLTYVAYQYKAHEPELRRYLAQVSADPDAYLATMYEKCYTMLPKRMHGKSPAATLYLTAFNNDAVAHGGDIILTLWADYNYSKVVPGILGGHELFHLVWKEKNYAVAEKDKSLLFLLNLLLREGAPDLIDKKHTAVAGFPDDLRYGEYLMQMGAKAMPLIETAIKEMATGTRSYSTKELRQTFMNGHVPGYYMADIIERNGLRNKLVKNVQDPFRFVDLYNEAAKKDKAKPFVFSDEVIAHLRRLKANVK